MGISRATIAFLVCFITVISLTGCSSDTLVGPIEVGNVEDRGDGHNNVEDRGDGHNNKVDG